MGVAFVDQVKARCILKLVGLSYICMAARSSVGGKLVVSRLSVTESALHS